MGIVKTVGVTTMFVFIVTLLIMIVMEVQGKYIINKLEEKNKNAKEEDKRGPVKILVIAIFTIIGFAICIAFRFRFISFASDCMGKWSEKPYKLKAILPEVIQNAIASVRRLFNFRSDDKRKKVSTSSNSKSDEVRQPESTNQMVILPSSERGKEK